MTSKRPSLDLTRALALVAVCASACGGIADTRSPGAGNDDGDPPAGTWNDPGGATGAGGDPGAGRPGAGGRRGRGTGGASTGGRIAVGGAPASSGGAAGWPSIDGGASDGGASDGGAASADAGAGSGGRVFDAGSDPERNRVPPGQACARVAEIACAGEAYCCNRTRPRLQCVQAVQSACRDGFLLDTMSLEAVVGYDMDRVEAAFAGYEERASQCDLDVLEWAISGQGFRNVARGTIAPGENCLPTSPQTVVAYASIVGCADPETYACLPEPIGATCAARQGVGGPCTTQLNCVDGLRCDTETFTGPSPVCAERKPLGAACWQALECASLACRGNSCVPRTIDTMYCLF